MEPHKVDLDYQQLESKQPLPQVEQRERKLVYNGRLIEELIKSEVWQDIIGPHLHTMITSSIGTQLPDGRWMVGDWAVRSGDNTDKDYNAGYSSGLMEFSNFIVNSVREKDTVLENENVRKKEEDNSQLVNPMQEEY